MIFLCCDSMTCYFYDLAVTLWCDSIVSVMDMVQTSYEPDAVVCQCGADGLSGDPHQCFNLSHDVYVRCVQYLRGWKRPLLLLGGGLCSFSAFFF